MRVILKERMTDHGLIVSKEFSRAGWDKNHSIESVEMTYADGSGNIYIRHDKGNFHMHSLDEDRLDGLTDAIGDLAVGTELEVIADSVTNTVHIRELPDKMYLNHCKEVSSWVRRMLANAQAGGHHV